MTFEVTPLTPTLGAEVTGLDLRRPLDGETVVALRAAWLEHLVLVFRGQALSEPQQVRFAEYFGAATEARQVQFRPDDTEFDPKVMLISNIRRNGELIGSLPDGELQFHSDSAFLERPLMATVLYGVTIPSRGGDTMFASAYRAYQALPDALKQRLAGCRAVNAFDYATQVRAGHLDRDNAVRAVHPVIRTHPETGGKALFVNRLMTEEIVDMDAAESAALLADLFDLVEQRAHVYTHVWRPGDLLMWDNRCTQHARNDFPAGESRLLKRVGLDGDRPY